MGHTLGRGKSATVPSFPKVNFSQSFGKQTGGGTDIVVMGGAVMGEWVWLIVKTASCGANIFYCESQKGHATTCN